MLLTCIFFSSILALVAARASHDRFDTRDALEEAEIQYLQASKEYMEELMLISEGKFLGNPLFVHPLTKS